MSVTTAEVQTLTAEVRVLMVGNRQVTLSVARQLDVFDQHSYPSDSFEPFGRVRTGLKTFWLDRRGREVMILPSYEWIGKNLRTGALSRYVLATPTDLVDDEEERALVRSWEDLPLIVLAGLK